MEDLLPESATHEMVETNDVQLHTITAGPADGPPVVLLHGFPEFWYGWRSQIPALADAGYRVVVPDQRGYNRSDKPAGIDSYTVDRLTGDAIGLLDAFEYEQARFVGHDWGAAVVWETLLRHPERVDRAVTMNVPHTAVFEEFLPGKPSQLLKSSYMFFFQLPKLPEVALSAGGWRGLRWFIDTSNRADTFTGDDLARYREAWSQPGAFTGMLNWYRALFRGDAPDPPTMTVEPPTMLVWGTQDPYLHREMAPASVDYCENGRLELIEDATHWVHHEVADRVNDLLLEFLENGS
jgi:pimeloyl-ACP methyl ester carboxylesterase